MAFSLASAGRGWALAALLFLALVLLARHRMHSGFFYPDLLPAGEGLTPGDFGLEYEEFTLPSEDGTPLQAWWVPRPGAREAVVFLHGNAADIRLPPRVRTVRLLHDWGYHVLTLDYRGYGASGGRPTHRGVLADARAAVRWASSRPEVDRLALYGHSLGGALALCAADVSERVAAVATQGTFDSARGIVVHVLGGLVGRHAARFAALLFHSPIEPLEHRNGWKAPVLLMAGSEDYVIPPSMSRRLYEALGPERAELWVEEGGLHVEAIDVSPRRYRARLESFLAAALKGAPRPRVEAAWRRGRLHVRCREAAGPFLRVEVHLWGAGGAQEWMETEVPCPEGSVPLDPGFTPLGAAALPALPSTGPAAQGLETPETGTRGGGPESP